jgi:hypothetical protein
LSAFSRSLNVSRHDDIDSAAANLKCVFCQIGTFKLLAKALSSIKRDEMVAFLQEGKAQSLILSLKAGGLNLAAANHVIHFDRWLNPAIFTFTRPLRAVFFFPKIFSTTRSNTAISK